MCPVVKTLKTQPVLRRVWKSEPFSVISVALGDRYASGRWFRIATRLMKTWRKPPFIELPFPGFHVSLWDPSGCSGKETRIACAATWHLQASRLEFSSRFLGNNRRHNWMKSALFHDYVLLIKCWMHLLAKKILQNHFSLFYKIKAL